jgi:predicted kinase
MIKLMDLLLEGVDDPGILKCVFLAGGPGSGKTYMTKGLFGVPDRLNISQSGMKMVNSDKELKFLLRKFGFGTDLDKMPDEVFQNLTTSKEKGGSNLRQFAKELTAQRKKKYQSGRLGMIIDGTGDDFKKIARMKKEVEGSGYDTYMIFVNCTLEVALQRNEKRDRVLPQKIVMDSHRAVMQNLGGLSGLFSGNFMIVDNNKDLDEKRAIKRFNMLVKQGLNKFINKPLKNPIGKSWIRKQKILKKQGN